MDPKISPNRDPPPNGIRRRYTAAPPVPLASRCAPVENRGCVRRTSGPSASAEPATPLAGQSGPAHTECPTSSLPDPPASEFPLAVPVAVDRFPFAAVPRFLAHAALGIPEVR